MYDIPDKAPEMDSHSDGAFGYTNYHYEGERVLASESQDTAHGDENQFMDLMYDPDLHCYYDPKTNKYYEPK